MEKGKRIIGIVLICVSIVALFSWEKWGRDRFIYDNVLVLNQNVEKGTTITADMVKQIKVGNRSKGSLAPKDRRWIIGKEANQYIRGETLLFGEYFKAKGLVAGADINKYVMNVTEDWIESCPGSISKGDTAYFYMNGKLVTSAAVSTVHSGERGFEIVATSGQAEAISKLAASGGRFVISYN